jgi:Mg-chelatase subunit ChlD
MQYYGGFATVFVMALVYVYITEFYTPPTCFDGRQNNDELGVDCGGGCVRICAFTVAEPTVRWARSFAVTDGQYNAVAYVENSNREAATPALRYTFSLYDEQGLITERSGETILPPNNVYPIFEGRIQTGNRVPTRTFIELEPAELWQPATAGREQFSVLDRALRGADGKPRLTAMVRNTDLEEVREVEVVATILDAEGNALNASRTFVENFAPRSDTEVVFTWLEPIATTMRSCEIPTDVALAIDLSGSMNDDGGEPPQPISAVKEAAAAFVARLGSQDQIGVTTFATDATLLLPLSENTARAATLVRELTIAPEEEVGSTNTGAAIGLAHDELESERHNDDARKVMVLLTDGLATAPEENPDEFALVAAAAAKASGVEIYTIGLGDNVDMGFVTTLASSPQQAYQALSQADIDQIYRTITTSLCEEGVATIDIVPKSDHSFVPLR